MIKDLEYIQEQLLLLQPKVNGEAQRILQFQVERIERIIISILN